MHHGLLAYQPALLIRQFAMCKRLPTLTRDSRTWGSRLTQDAGKCGCLNLVTNYDHNTTTTPLYYYYYMSSYPLSRSLSSILMYTILFVVFLSSVLSSSFRILDGSPHSEYHCCRPLFLPSLIEQYCPNPRPPYQYFRWASFSFPFFFS